MIRVWVPKGIWEALADSAPEDRIRPLKVAGARVQLGASAGGIEWLRRCADASARAGFGAAELVASRRLRDDQFTLAAISRLGWRPFRDETAKVFAGPVEGARVDAWVVPRVRCAWIQELHLLAGIQERQGVGTRALRSVLGWAAGEGAEVVRVSAPKSAVGFLVRHGFEVAGADGVTGVRLVRELGGVTAVAAKADVETVAHGEG